MPDHAAKSALRDQPRSVRSIAIITNNAYSVNNFRGPMIRAMVDAGLQVHALAPDYDDKTRAAARALGAEPVDISLDRTGLHPVRDAIDFFRMVRTLRRLKPDATFGYFIKPVIYGSIAARVAGIPLRYALVAGLGYIFTPDGARDTLRRKALRIGASVLYRIGFKACHRVFFQNEEDIAQFVGAGLINPQQVFHLNATGVELDRFAFRPPPAGPTTFLLMARLLREKGIIEYVEAARAVRQSHPKTRFLLVGGADSNPGGLPSGLAETWMAEGLLVWPGHVDDVRPWIDRSHVYVLPSYREGKPRSTQEAMAMGLPIITTDVPGCRGTVDDGVNGFLVPVRDSTALAAAMRRFLDDPSLIEKMGRESRRLAHERFDVHEMNARILGVIGIEHVGPANRPPVRMPPSAAGVRPR